MKTKDVKDLIYVFGNPLRAVRSIASTYNIGVVGTTDENKLLETLSQANDASHFFLIITGEEELFAINEMFKRRVKPEITPESTNIYVICEKSLVKGLNFYGNLVMETDYENQFTEEIVEELIIQTVVENQIQYYTMSETVYTTTTAEGMRETTNLLRNYEKGNVLSGIKKNFERIKEEQRDANIIDVISGTANDGRHFKINSQEYLIERDEELKANLSNANLSDEERKEIMETRLELYYLMTDDLRDNSTLMEDIIQASLVAIPDKEKEIEELFIDMEDALLKQDMEELDILKEKRKVGLQKLNKERIELKVHTDLVKDGLLNYYAALKDNTQDFLTGTCSELIPVEEKRALASAFNESKDHTLALSKDSVQGVVAVIDRQDGLIDSYSRMADMSTYIIESQDRVNKILRTQNVRESVTYQDSLSSKLYLITSPSPSVGTSVLASSLRHRYTKGILILDFRERTSTTFGYEEMDMDKFFQSDIGTLPKYLKLKDSRAMNINESIMTERLQNIESHYETILVLVDDHFTVGVDYDIIQRIVYISDSDDDNLIEVNKLRQLYEPILPNINRVTFILNKVTSGIQSNIQDKLLTAAVNPSEVKVIPIPMKIEIMEDRKDDRQYKILSKELEL